LQHFMGSAGKTLTGILPFPNQSGNVAPPTSQTLPANGVPAPASQTLPANGVPAPGSQTLPATDVPKPGNQTLPASGVGRPTSQAVTLPIAQPDPEGQVIVGPGGTAVVIPAGYVAEAAMTGKGVVYRPAGSTGNANTIRVMEPTAQYPTGYVRIYNGH